MKKQIRLISVLLMIIAITMADAQERKNEHKDHQITSGKKSDKVDAVKGHDKGGMMDKHFIEEMIPHHQDAIDMANLALLKSKNDDIKKLAGDIIRTQTAEIETMKKWYREWYGTDVPLNGRMKQKMKTDMKGMDAHDKNMMMMDMSMGHDMMGGTIDDLKKAADFDRAFLDMMIKHHKMAVMMSGMIIDSPRAELRKMAGDIMISQSGEIEKMIRWKSEMPGNDDAHSGH